MELSGAWAAAPADEALRRSLPDPDLDDRSWSTLPVPGHWRSSPEFSRQDEPVLYRRRFEAPRPPAGRRSWLTMEGVFYQSGVWVDGSYLGDTEGYFFPHTFEVTRPLDERTEHLVAVEVACPRPRDLTAKRALTGVFQHWDSLDPDWNPGGLWRPVRLSETGPVRIARLRVLCSEASPERAVLDVRAVLDAAGPGQVGLRTTVGPLTGPDSQHDPQTDLLRVHGHVSRPELYAAADRAGLLLWQDLPLQWGYARVVRREAARQAREAVDLLGHHPSIAVWCGHNEPFALALEPGAGLQGGARLIARFVAAQELPTYNRTILDASVKRALERADPTRPVIAHSVVLPHPGSGGTDSHLYFGWSLGRTADPGPARAAFPRLARFPTEFGAQALPESDDFVEQERWPDLEWPRLGRTH